MPTKARQAVLTALSGELSHSLDQERLLRRRGPPAQILPFSSGAHAAAGVGSLAMLQFDQVPGLGVVHLGGATGGVCLESQADLALHARVFEQLRAFALSPAQSALLLRGLADD